MMKRTVVVILVLLGYVSAYCDFTPLSLGCDDSPLDGFVDVNLNNDSYPAYQAVFAITTALNGTAIRFADALAQTPNGTTQLAASTIKTVNNSFRVSSPSMIHLDTLDHSGLMFEGRVQLWMTGIDVTDNSKPICLMMNDTIISCLDTISASDADLVLYWKYTAISLALFVFGLFVGVFIGACSYRARMQRIATDPDIVNIRLDDDENL